MAGIRYRNTRSNNIRVARPQLNRAGNAALTPGWVQYVPPPGPVDDVLESKNGLTVLDVWSTAWRHKGMIALAGVLAALLAAGVTKLETPIYQARATLEFQDLNQEFLNIKQVLPVSESANYSALIDVQTQIQILQSERVLERTIADLQKREFKQANLPDALERAKNSLTLETSGQTRVVEARFTSPDSNYASNFLNTLFNEFIEQNLDSRWEMSQRTSDWLQRQLGEARAKLEHSEEALQRYARRAGLPYTDEKTTVTEQKLMQLQQELTKASADRVQTQSRLEIARRSAPETLSDVLHDTTLREYQAKLTDLRRQYAELSITYTPQHPSVKKVEAQISSLEAALEREQHVIVQRITNDYEEALRRERLLANDYGIQARELSLESEKAIEFNIAKREVDSNRQIYEGMLQRVRDVGLAGAAVRTSGVRVIDAARPQRTPHKPVMWHNVTVGSMAGTILGLFAVVVLYSGRRTLQEPGDAARLFNIRELGVIPSIERPRWLGLEVGGTLERPFGGMFGTTIWGSDRRQLPALNQKGSPVSESFRDIRTSLMFSRAPNYARVLCFASALPAEGKTTVASNMAVVVAELGQKVLLIDADLRKPSIHKFFDLPQVKGLADILSGEKDIAPRPTSIPNLWILQAGACSGPSAANLLSSPSFRSRIAEFQRQFDLILIDTPPILPVTDARVVARISDGVIIVIRAGQTTCEAAEKALELLLDDRVPVVGTILNNWRPTPTYINYAAAYRKRGEYTA